MPKQTPYDRAQSRHAELDRSIERLNALERVFITTTVGSLVALGAISLIEGVFCLTPAKTLFLNTLTSGCVGWRLIPKLEEEDTEEQSFNRNIFVPSAPNPNGVVELVMGPMIRLAKKHTFLGKLFPDKKVKTPDPAISMVPDISVKEILLRTNELTARIQKSQHDKKVWRTRTLGLLVATGGLCGVQTATERVESFMQMGTIATFFGANMWGAAVFMEQRRQKALNRWNNMFSFTISPDDTPTKVIDVPATTAIVITSPTPTLRAKWLNMLRRGQSNTLFK